MDLNPVKYSTAYYDGIATLDIDIENSSQWKWNDGRSCFEFDHDGMKYTFTITISDATATMGKIDETLGPVFVFSSDGDIKITISIAKERL